MSSSRSCSGPYHQPFRTSTSPTFPSPRTRVPTMSSHAHRFSSVCATATRPGARSPSHWSRRCTEQAAPPSSLPRFGHSHSTIAALACSSTCFPRKFEQRPAHWQHAASRKFNPVPQPCAPWPFEPYDKFSSSTGQLRRQPSSSSFHPSG
jgi:hypothetical protein